ncbi:hypothetical protein ABZS66_27095 [Dactylosporangium sp. NPDC005572]|uniref:hypothetical protein n=1 Tax=Dactylosporangium sp. NPDC005572 TaxID=3156889 RepID=UPI0033B96865
MTPIRPVHAGKRHTGKHRIDPDTDARPTGMPAAETSTELIDQAHALLAAYRFPDAYQRLLEVRSLMEHGVPVEHTDAFDAIRMLAESMVALGWPDEAEALLDDLAAWGGLGPHQLAMLAITRARMLVAQRRLDDAEACYRDAVARQDDPRARWPALLATAGVARIIAARGRGETAEPTLTLAYRWLVTEYGTAPVEVVRVGVELAELRSRLGHHDTARGLVASIYPAAASTLGAVHPLVVRLAAVADDLETERHERDRPSTASTSSRRSSTVAARRNRPDRLRQGRWRGEARRPLPYWLLVGAVVCAGTAAAIAAVMITIAQVLPPREPGRDRSPMASAVTIQASRSPLLQLATDVRIVRDAGTSLDVAWTDPSGGRRPALLFVAKDSAPAVVAATVPAATTSYRLTGLDPHARQYCIGVAIAYTTTTVRAADVCTNRPSAVGTQA